MFDLIVKGGKVFDGSEKEAIFADIGIVGDRIKEVGNLTGADAREVISATGLIVMPGFIDAHSHSDENYLVNPLAESKLRQGITTEVIGNCGSSPFPLSPATQQQLQQDIKDWGIKVDWTTAEGFFARLEAVHPAINIVPLVGQGTIRAAVIGYEDRPPTSQELAQMKDLLREALASGCWGFSSGLIYPPGCFTPTAELIELAKLLHPVDGIYTSHIRSEGDQLLEAIDEALNIGRSAGIRVQISHLKAAGARNWGKAEKALQKIDRAINREGLAVGFARYTYTASATSLSSLLPNWAHQGGRQQTIEYLKDPDTSERIETEMRQNLEGAQGWG
ncbi:MAG: amidohydrolase family protein, partial [Candidatus Sumerlaeia bacterium]|nr:amidohydrolase family protein [Candidatus Sumerlaeia bacterium]